MFYLVLKVELVKYTCPVLLKKISIKQDCCFLDSFFSVVETCDTYPSSNVHSICHLFVYGKIGYTLNTMAQKNIKGQQADFLSCRVFGERVTLRIAKVRVALSTCE